MHSADGLETKAFPGILLLQYISYFIRIKLVLKTQNCFLVCVIVYILSLKIHLLFT